MAMNEWGKRKILDNIGLLQEGTDDSRTEEELYYG